MRKFTVRQIREALIYAAQGGQALHLHRFVFPNSPGVFRNAVAKGQDVAHLFDTDYERLVDTAKALGVRTIVVERRDTVRQHIDLCCGPLKKALAMVEDDSQGIT